MIGCEMMRTLANVEFESILILGLLCCLSSSSILVELSAGSDMISGKAFRELRSLRCLPQCLLTQRVPPRLTELRAPECPNHFLRILTRLLGRFVWLRQTLNPNLKDPIDTETLGSPHAVASPTSLPRSTPPTCHTKESKDSDTSGARSTSSYSTIPLSPDHPITCTSPTPAPTRASFHYSTTRITMRAQPVMFPGHSARVAEAMALSDSALHKSKEEEEIGGEDTNKDEGHRLDDEGHGLDEDEGHGLDDVGHGLDDEGRSVESDGLGLKGEEEAVPKGQQQVASVMETTMGEPLGLSYGALRHRELAVEEDQVYNTFKVGQGSGFVPELERPERVSAVRQPTLTTWRYLEDGIAYIDIPAYPPPAPPAQTPPSPEWSSGSLPVSSAPSAIPSPISSPIISLAIPSLTPTATILVDEDQFIEIGAHLELFRGILWDHTQRLDAMPPTLFTGIDRDVRELYTRSGVVRDEILSQRPVLALEAWAGHVNTRMTYMSQAGYDDHRLVHDMLVQQAALQHELQEMRGRVTALE
ncbi:hypothetical protein Tco_0238717 [Tanacetum coccineum]